MWQSYSSVLDRVRAVSAGLATINPHRMPVALYGNNCADWVISEYACHFNSLITVPLYDTLGHDASLYITSETKLSVIMVSKMRLKNAVQVAAKSEGVVRYIIQFEDTAVPEALIAESKALNVTLMTLSDLAARGKAAASTVTLVSPVAADIATICYTSGTTGVPKGAMLTHENFCSATTANKLNGDIVVDQTDRHISYLPLAHIFERLMQVGYLMHGSAIGFYTGDVVNLLADVAALKVVLELDLQSFNTPHHLQQPFSVVNETHRRY